MNKANTISNDHLKILFSKEYENPRKIFSSPDILDKDLERIYYKDGFFYTKRLEINRSRLRDGVKKNKFVLYKFESRISLLEFFQINILDISDMDLDSFFSKQKIFLERIMLIDIYTDPILIKKLIKLLYKYQQTKKYYNINKLCKPLNKKYIENIYHHTKKIEFIDYNGWDLAEDMLSFLEDRDPRFVFNKVLPTNDSVYRLMSFIYKCNSNTMYDDLDEIQENYGENTKGIISDSNIDINKSFLFLEKRLSLNLKYFYLLFSINKHHNCVDFKQYIDRSTIEFLKQKLISHIDKF